MNDVFMNRELSWLKFNERVLEEAEDENTPLCERLSFVSIYQSNLDEFFMVRVGSLVDQDDVSPKMRENKTHMTAKEQIDAVIARVHELNGRRDAVYARLMEKLEEQGVRLVDFRKIGRQESERLERYFDSEIAPLISAFHRGPPPAVPLSAQQCIYAVVVLEGKKGKYKLGIIPCSAGVFPALNRGVGQREDVHARRRADFAFHPQGVRGIRREGQEPDPRDAQRRYRRGRAV